HYVDESAALHKELKEAYQVFFEVREKELQKARKEANKIIAEAEENAETNISDIRKMQLESGQQGGVNEHQVIDAKTQLSQLHHEESKLAKNKVLKKAKEQKILKAGDEVIV
ncbi:endonuclease MutS2, partial [Enterococcus faecalis]